MIGSSPSQVRMQLCHRRIAVSQVASLCSCHDCSEVFVTTSKNEMALERLRENLGDDITLTEACTSSGGSGTMAGRVSASLKESASSPQTIVPKNQFPKNVAKACLKAESKIYPTHVHNCNQVQTEKVHHRQLQNSQKNVQCFRHKIPRWSSRNSFNESLYTAKIGTTRSIQIFDSQLCSRIIHHPPC